MGNDAEHVQLERGEGVIPAGIEGQMLGDELNRHAGPGEVVDELSQVDHGAGQAVHGGDPNGVTAAHVADQSGQGGSLGAAFAADRVGERLGDVDVAEGDDVTGGCYFDR